MFKSILKLIEEFVLKPASLNSGVLFVVSFLILFLFLKNFKKTLFTALTGTLGSFLFILFFMTLSVKFNEPKYLVLIYPFILNVWFFTLKKLKYGILFANLFMITVFLSDFYLVDKLLFE